MLQIVAALQHISQQFGQIIRQESVRKAFRNVAGAIIPLLIAMWLGYEQLGIELMLGVILIAAADIKEPIKDKIVSLLIAAAMIFALTLIICLIARQYWLLIPILFIIVFILSYAAPFGTRYASVAFSGTLAIIIALSTYRLYQDIPTLIYHTFSMLAGSGWYMAYTLIIDWLSAKKQVKELVADGMSQTVEYLKLRVGLIYSEEPLWKGLLALSEKQADLTTAHGEMREFLLRDLSQIRKPKSFQRRMLLIFAEQLEMLEAALATPLDYHLWHQWLKKYPELDILPQISKLGIQELERLTAYLNGNQQAQSHQPEMHQLMEKARGLLRRLQEEAESDPEKQKIYRQAGSISIYQKVQLKKLHSIEGILQGKFNQTENLLDESAYQRFLNARFITWESIKGNFTFRSSYFRYALRTSVTAILGFIIGIVLGLENAYWVLLTVLVVMKPGYTVTRQRFMHRIAGTIGGALIAYGLYLLQPSHAASLTIFALSFFLAFSFVPHIYAVSTIFFTIYVVFLYSFLHKEIPIAVVYRVVDTTLGASLCYFALHYLWPSWEHQTFPYYLRDSVRANHHFFSRIIRQIISRNVAMTDYRLARKNAYILMSNSVTSYQRFRTEPKSKRKFASEYGDMLLLNYGILATISTIGVYLHRYPSANEALDGMKEQFIALCKDFNEVLANIDGSMIEAAISQKAINCDHISQEWHSSSAVTTPSAMQLASVDFVETQLSQLAEQLARLKGVAGRKEHALSENPTEPLLQ